MRGPTVTDWMIEKGARALVGIPDGVDWPNGMVQREMQSEASCVVNAVMPVVDTVEALDALPYGTKLLDAAGSVWWRSGIRGFWFADPGVTALRSTEVLAEAPPVCVIWMPEADR